MDTLSQRLPKDLSNIILDYADEWKEKYYNMMLDYDISASRTYEFRMMKDYSHPEPLSLKTRIEHVNYFMSRYSNSEAKKEIPETLLILDAIFGKGYHDHHYDHDQKIEWRRLRANKHREIGSWGVYGTS